MRKSYPVAEEVRSFVERHQIGRVTDDRTLLLDLLDPSEILQRCVIPTSFGTEEYAYAGLQFLRKARLEIVVILTMHRNKGDFEDLLKIAGSFLTHSPVSGVEASTAKRPELHTVASPVLHPSNQWLREFQKEQFEWHRQNNKLMLPSEAFFCGRLGERFTKLGKLFDELRADAQGYSKEARQQILRLIYANISTNRAWGILGQFGWWLQHPMVRQQLEKMSGRIPLTLGRAHVYEVEILKAWGLDVEAVDVITHLKTADAETCMKDPFVNLYRHEVPAGYVMHSELNAHTFV